MKCCLDKNFAWESGFLVYYFSRYQFGNRWYLCFLGFFERRFPPKHGEMGPHHLRLFSYSVFNLHDLFPGFFFLVFLVASQRKWNTYYSHVPNLVPSQVCLCPNSLSPYHHPPPVPTLSAFLELTWSWEPSSGNLSRSVPDAGSPAPIARSCLPLFSII